MAITHLYPHDMKSNGAAQIAAALGIKRIKHENSKFKGNQKRSVINWGSSNLPEEVLKCNVINKPEAVRKCTNKLTFFKEVAGKVSIPDFTTDIQEALKWTAEGHTVCARTVLQGSGGEGLILMDKNNSDNFVKAPLYTKYVPKMDEYRVHVVNKEVTDVQRKALRANWQDEHPNEKPNFKVRNLENGFVYVRQNVDAPKSVIEQAIRAIESVGLDFGAVDVVFNHKQDRAYVLEVNCAPGVEGQSIDNYKNAFLRMK